MGFCAGERKKKPVFPLGPLLPLGLKDGQGLLCTREEKFQRYVLGGGNHVISPCSVTVSVHDQPRDQCMICHMISV